MDNLIGLLVFIAIMTVVSIARKIQEAKQEAARKQQPTLRREDLPESTRQRLYGDGPDLELDVPMAKPRRESTAAPQRPQRPQRPDSVYERPPEWELQSRDEHAPAGWEKAARPEERRVPWEEAPTPPAPQRRAPIPVSQQRPRPQQPPRPQAAEDPLRQAREFMEQLMGYPAPQPEPVRAPRPQRAPKQAARRQAPQAAHPAATPARTASKPQQVAKETTRRSPAFHELIHDLDSVRRGIILLEVLGPPKSLQDI